MTYLNWINDQDLTNAILHLLNIANNAQKQAEENFNKNVIDPFSAILQIAGFGIDYKSWVISEQTRQSQKTFQNHIGNFHQIVLGNVEGWQNLKTGNIMDLLSTDKKILAEIKNKHNTVTGANLAGLYRSMENTIMPKYSRYKDYTVYYVTVIPKKAERFNKPFTPPDKETGSKLAKNEKIRIIDGASFYNMVTGEQHALKQLFDCLPKVIEDAIGTKFSVSDTENLKRFFNAAYG
jgi:hypothetical protein